MRREIMSDLELLKAYCNLTTDNQQLVIDYLTVLLQAPQVDPDCQAKAALS